MKIGPAKEMANLLRLLHKLEMLDCNQINKAIDEIQVWVLEYELNPLKFSLKDPLLPWLDLVDESDLNPI